MQGVGFLGSKSVLLFLLCAIWYFLNYQSLDTNQHLSAYFQKHRDRYYTYLTEIRETANFKTPTSELNLFIEEWIRYQDNAKNEIILAAVGSQCIEVNAAKSFWVMYAAAAADGVKIKVSSGFRPPFQAVTAKSSKGVQFKFTSQVQLRTVDRWRGKGPFDNNAIYNAGASSFFPATAAPGKSQHGNGVAIDINTAATIKFTAALTKSNAGNS